MESLLKGLWSERKQVREAVTLDPMERAFYPIWRELVTNQGAIILGVSGGGDSMALLAMTHAVRAMGELNLDLIPVHINHGLRPDSDREAEQLRDYILTRFGLKLETVVVSLDPSQGLGIEMAAREVRHRALETARQVHGAGLIALAHQADDQVETVLMRILTGTSIAGLAAIAVRRDNIVHPLLGYRRQDLRQYLERKHIHWLEDPSNQDRRYLRNQVRLEVLPYLRSRINPKVDRALLALAEQAKDSTLLTEDYTTALIGQQRLRFEGDHIHWPSVFSDWPGAVQGELLARFAMHHDLRLQENHIRSVLRHKGVSWPKGWQLTWTQSGELCLAKPTRGASLSDWQSVNAVPFESGDVAWPGRGRLLVESAASGEGIAHSWQVRYSSRVNKPDDAIWQFRTWQPGDRLRPVGLGGSKKVQDIFMDRKIPVALRHQWPILVAGGGEVISVIGLADDVTSRQSGTDWVVIYTPDSNPGVSCQPQESNDGRSARDHDGLHC